VQVVSRHTRIFLYVRLVISNGKHYKHELLTQLERKKSVLVLDERILVLAWDPALRDEFFGLLIIALVALNDPLGKDNVHVARNPYLIDLQTGGRRHAWLAAGDDGLQAKSFIYDAFEIRYALDLVVAEGRVSAGEDTVNYCLETLVCGGIKGEIVQRICHGNRCSVTM
jgi:hypothetical protein